MTPQDHELLLALRRQQADIQQSLERLTTQLNGLEARAQAALPEVFLPPVPLEPEFPPIPAPPKEEVVLPPIPAREPVHVIQTLPPLPPPDRIPKPSFESQFGRWLTRIGPVFGVIALALIFAMPGVQTAFGPRGLLGLCAALGIGGVILAERLERKGGGLLFFGRALLALALAWLYLTAYAACFYEGLRVIRNPLVAGFVLLLWSIYALILAERKKSQTLALFAIALAYFSTALNPLGSFTIAADLVLAVASAILLVRNGWAVVSYAGLLGVYLALLRQLVIDEDGDLVLDTSRTLSFGPHAAGLVAAWLIFALAMLLTAAPTFRGPRRLALLSLNNAALASLLMLTAYISGYGYVSVGWTLLDTGFVFLLMSRFAGWARVEPVEIMGAYAAQGLALVTAGITIVYTGITRAVLLILETLFLGAAATFSGDRILTVSTYVAGFFATLFPIWEIAVNGHHPWLLGLGGAAVMFMNAWWARCEIRHSPRARHTVVPATSYYCALAVGLIFTAMATELRDDTLPPALALAGLALTFSIYFVALFELPPVAQALLLAAQVFVLFPADTGEELPWWSAAIVAVITLLLLTWWTRQRVTRSGPWTVALTFVYALALVGLAIQAAHPQFDGQDWMAVASFLSVAFLVYGAFTRVWPIAAAGQLFLAIALYHFFLPPDRAVFPRTWWEAALPLAVVFATARAAREWLRLFPEIPIAWRGPLGLLARGYQLLALAMLIRWVFGVVAPLDQIATFFFLGMLIVSSNVRPPSSFGVRCGFVLSAIGMVLYCANFQENAVALATYLNGLAVLVFLTQPALLRLGGKTLIIPLESWALILFSAGTGWIFASEWVMARFGAGYLTMGWALYALFLFLLGLLLWERRYRWCGLAVLMAAIVRVCCHDFWGLSGGYRVLTFVALAFITIGLGYIIARFADRPRSWL